MLISTRLFRTARSDGGRGIYECELGNVPEMEERMKIRWKEMDEIV